MVEHIGKNERFNLIETLANKIAKTILSKFPICEVVVRVRKLSPPIEGVLGYVEVEITRKRSDR